MVNVQKFSVVFIAKFLDGAPENVVNQITDW